MSEVQGGGNVTGYFEVCLRYRVRDMLLRTVMCYRYRIEEMLLCSVKCV